MNYHFVKGFLNSTIKNLPLEIYLPKSNKCGARTKGEKLLARNNPGINELNEGCNERDIFYPKENDLACRHGAHKEWT